MSGNVIVAGVIFIPLVAQILIAVVLTVLISFFSVRLNLFRFVVHRPLAEVCVFCIILGLLVGLSPEGGPGGDHPPAAERHQ